MLLSSNVYNTHCKLWTRLNNVWKIETVTLAHLCCLQIVWKRWHVQTFVVNMETLDILWFPFKVVFCLLHLLKLWIVKQCLNNYENIAIFKIMLRSLKVWCFRDVLHQFENMYFFICASNILEMLKLSRSYNVCVLFLRHLRFWNIGLSKGSTTS